MCAGGEKWIDQVRASFQQTWPLGGANSRRSREAAPTLSSEVPAVGTRCVLRPGHVRTSSCHRPVSGTPPALRRRLQSRWSAATPPRPPQTPSLPYWGALIIAPYNKRAQGAGHGPSHARAARALPGRGGRAPRFRRGQRPPPECYRPAAQCSGGPRRPAARGHAGVAPADGADLPQRPHSARARRARDRTTSQG